MFRGEKEREGESWVQLMMICHEKENVLTLSLGLCLPPSTPLVMAQPRFLTFSLCQRGAVLLDSTNPAASLPVLSPAGQQWPCTAWDGSLICWHEPRHVLAHFGLWSTINILQEGNYFRMGKKRHLRQLWFTASITKCLYILLALKVTWIYFCLEVKAFSSCL